MLFSSEFEIIGEPARTIIVSLTIILIVASYLGGLYLLLSTRSPEMRESRKYFFGIALVAFFFGTGRLIFLIHDYYIPDYIGTINMDELLWKMGSCISSTGGVIFVYIIETYIYKKSEHFFTIIGSLFVVLMIFTSYPMPSKTISAIGNVILMFVAFIIYIGIYINSTDDVKKNALFIIIGLMILTLGQGTVLFSDYLQIISIEISSIIAPPITLAGLFVTGMGLIRGKSR